LRVGAHWRKAPFALVHHASVLLAVVVAALLSALASSSSPFVTTAAASEALKNQLADLSPFATGLELKSSWLLSGRGDGPLVQRATTALSSVRFAAPFSGPNPSRQERRRPDDGPFRLTADDRAGTAFVTALAASDRSGARFTGEDGG
jgi:hypothetical protein